MSDRFEHNDRSSRIVETFQLTEVPHVDAGKFEPIERAAIERILTEQQELLASMQTDVLEVRTERNALEHQLSKLETDRAQLQDRIRELEATRPALEPKTVFSNLGAALEEVDDDLASERYRVDDVDFTLKTNVIQTDEGIRMHLPSLDETSASANLSEVSFRLRAPRKETERPEAAYIEVPDLRGLPQETAAQRLAAANLAVGTVESIVDPTARPGTVLEQFPDSHAVTEPEAPVDLVLAEAPDPPEAEETESETTGPPADETADEDEAADAEEITGEEEATEEDTETEGDTETKEDTETETELSEDEAAHMEEFRRVLVEVDPESGSEVVERLHQAGIDDFDSLLQRDPEELAEQLSIPNELIVSLQNELSAHHEPIPLEEITGIGSTYADRLRKEGVQGVSELAELDPETVSEISNASTSRAADWIEQAKQMVQHG